MNNAYHNDVRMKRILKWHKLSQLTSACIYITVLPFLVLFILHTTKPDFEWCHLCMRILLGIATVLFVGRIINALVIKFRVNQWEHAHHTKMSDKELIQLM